MALALLSLFLSQFLRVLQIHHLYVHFPALLLPFLKHEPLYQVEIE